MTLEHCIAIAIGHRVRTLRLARGLSQSELGARINRPAQQVSRLERAGRGSVPSLTSVLELARALDVHPVAVLSVLDHFAPRLEAEHRREGESWTATWRVREDRNNRSKGRARRVRAVLDRWQSRRTEAA